jgi:hypothetical protein
MDDPQRRREPYEKPVIQRIRIVPEEMAVVGCKTASSLTGPTTGCAKSVCKFKGS